MSCLGVSRDVGKRWYYSLNVVVQIQSRYNKVPIPYLEVYYISIHGTLVVPFFKDRLLSVACSQVSVMG